MKSKFGQDTGVGGVEVEGVVLGRGNNLYEDSEIIKRKRMKATSKFLAWMIECHSLK